VSNDDEKMKYSLKDLKITVPEELIAQYPRKNRESSRLLVFNINTQKIIDDYFFNLPRYISKQDCIVYNDAKVIKARIFGEKHGTGAKLEILLLRKISSTEWTCLIRPARRVKKQMSVSIKEGLSLKVIDMAGEGIFRVQFSENLDYPDLEEIGEIPLPKYINRKAVKEIDDILYQTVFSNKYGAVASPTAGLHFTEQLIEKIKAKGALWVPITLYVDWATFKPVRADDYRKHEIHREIYEISEESALVINRCITERRRIMCIGTTSVRTVETAVDRTGMIRSGRGETDLYIYPGYRFKLIDGMVTNFHMPDSTLILLVMAFAGEEGIRKAYNHAVKEEYRFFSYGDAMLIMKD
jgi:S-adenosylmethionine:tRNA ribosyltransferase-isomerase